MKIGYNCSDKKEPHKIDEPQLIQPRLTRFTDAVKSFSQELYAGITYLILFTGRELQHNVVPRPTNIHLTFHNVFSKMDI